MCTSHPTRKYCATCGEHYDTQINRVRNCLKFKLTGYCGVGIVDKDSWLNYFREDCQKCIQAEKEKEEMKQQSQQHDEKEGEPAKVEDHSEEEQETGNKDEPVESVDTGLETIQEEK